MKTLLLTFALLLVAISVRPTRSFGQNVYLAAPLNNVMRVYEYDDTTMYVVLSVSPDSASGIPDNASHHYTILGGTYNNSYFLSPTVAGFRGYDTIYFTYRPTPGIPAYDQFTFVVDDTLTDSIRISATPIHYVRPAVITDSLIKRGARATRQVSIVNSRQLPNMRLIAARVTGDGRIQMIDSSLHVPSSLSSADNRINFNVSITPGDTAAVHAATLVLVIERGNDLIDSLVVPLTYHFIDPDLGECIEITDLELDGYDPFESTVDSVLVLRNLQPVPVTITGYTTSPFDSSFHIVGAMPVTLAAGESIHLPFHVKPSSAWSGQLQVRFDIGSVDSDNIACPASQTRMIFRPAFSEQDTTAIRLSGTTTTPISMVIEEEARFPVVHAIQFVNDSTIPLRIAWGELIYGDSSLKISHWGYSPDSLLQPGASFLASIIFHFTRHGGRGTPTYLRLHYSDSSVSRDFPIELTFHIGVRFTAAVTPNIVIAPNPAHSVCSIYGEDVLRGTIEIYDALGRSVRTTRFAGGQPIEENIATLPSATYIVRVSGRTTEGAPFITSRSLIIQH